MRPHQNYAVAAIRDKKKTKIDDYPTPCWATRALIEKVLHVNNIATNEQSVWEPSANRGYMVRPLEEYFGFVTKSDKFDYDNRWPVLDFLSVNTHEVPPTDWVITNPPFSLAQEFIEQGLRVSRVGVAVLVRTAFVESIHRYEKLFSVNPPTAICQFVERVPMVNGRMDKKSTTATSYSWLVWLKQAPSQAPIFLWIPPCRKELERDGDYDELYTD